MSTFPEFFTSKKLNVCDYTNAIVDRWTFDRSSLCSQKRNP